MVRVEQMLKHIEPVLVFDRQLDHQCRNGAVRLSLSEWIGVLIALLSSSLGGTAAAITRFRRRSSCARSLAPGNRLSWLAACMPLDESPLARAARLAGHCNAGARVLRRVFHSLQYRDLLHHCGPCKPRAGNASVAHHGRGVASPYGDPHAAQDGGSWHCGAGRGG